MSDKPKAEKNADTIQRGALTDTERERLRGLVEIEGEAEAARLVGINRHTLARAVAGLDVYPGTRALVLRWLEAEEDRP